MTLDYRKQKFANIGCRMALIWFWLRLQFQYNIILMQENHMDINTRQIVIDLE